MFVRKLKSKNGKVYIQVIDKSSGSYKVVKNFGSKANANEIDILINKANSWIKNQQGIQEFDFANEKELVEGYLSSINQLRLVGIDLLLGKIFTEIGFDELDDIIFRQLVFYRLFSPRSKLKTTEYLNRYQQIDWSEDKIYRYMDKLYHKQKETVQRISYKHSLKILNNNISVVFYDVTTIYFEVDKEDDLRKTGFSKEGKHQNPQIVLGLLVSKEGYPMAYEIFEGNKFEGHTMLPILNEFKRRYEITDLIVVADSGLMSSSNITELQNKGYGFILGARIKNEKQEIKDQILALELTHGQSEIIKKDNLKLIITYSDVRAKKDKYNREKGLKKLEKQIKAGKLSKANINNRGYNKYLKLDGEIKVSIDLEKFSQDEKWDGLKGYTTNAKQSKEEILENYHHLWKIEKAFRVAKTDLKIRPIYHRLQRRIEAHICLSFVAYKVYKELERQLKTKNAQISPNKAIEIASNIFEVQIQTPINKEIIKKTLLLTDEQRYLAQIFQFGC